jgi:hypothetical protein
MSNIQEQMATVAQNYNLEQVVGKNIALQEGISNSNLLRAEGIEILPENELAELIENIEDTEEEFKERRRDFRLNTNLTGSYVANGSGERGLITLRDLSYSGIRYELNSERIFYPDAKKLIKFSLDTYPLTVISREVTIKFLSGKVVGAEFVNEYQRDALPHYLRFRKRLRKG